MRHTTTFPQKINNLVILELGFSFFTHYDMYTLTSSHLKLQYELSSTDERITGKEISSQISTAGGMTCASTLRFKSQC